MQSPVIRAAAVLGVLFAPSAALAQDEHASHHVAQAPSQAASALTEGEVRKVDKEGGKVTLKHGPIENLNMPPMTMVFRAKDPAMLDQVKAGDKVRFRVEHIAGQYTVTRIEPAP